MILIARYNGVTHYHRFDFAQLFMT